MIDFFKELFQYSYTMNQQLIDELKKNEEAFSEKALTLLNHVINAQQIWNHRIKASPEGIKVWEHRPSDQLELLNKTNFERSLTILDEENLNSIITYRNSQGQEFSNSVRDILFHVINHSTYHRAQIATEMKQAGYKPLITDYIFYKR